MKATEEDLEKAYIRRELDKLKSAVELFRKYNDCNHIVKESSDGNILVIHRGPNSSGELDPQEGEYEDVILVSPDGMISIVKRNYIYEKYNTGRERIF